MRRAIASTIAIVFSVLLIAPLFGPDADANLPACCRRHGKHHCSMSLLQDRSTPGFNTIAEKCPCIPAAACTLHSAPWRAAAVQSFSALDTQTKALPTQPGVSLQLLLLKGDQKRGPPNLL